MISDCEVIKIAQKYGTPLYLYDKDIIEERVDDLKRILPKQADIFYSIKANPLNGICQIMREKDLGIEVASMGEMSIALNNGINPLRIIFSGPGKTEEELTAAIGVNIGCINIESFEEAYLINKIAKRDKKEVKCAIRVNPNFSAERAKMKMVGEATQFGIDESEIINNKEIFCLENIKWIGWDFYLGTQNLDAIDIVGNTEKSIETAYKLSQICGVKMSYLNLGGGFGISYFLNEKPLDIQYLKVGLEKLIKKYEKRIEDIHIIFESGRFIIAESGSFITKVLYRKESRGEIYLICDGGANIHSSAAFLGRYVRNNFPIRVITDNSDMETVTIVGPLCTPTDIIGKKVNINKACKGDYVLIEKSGAYGLTHSPIMFLSHELPVEILYDKGNINVLRKHQSIAPLIGGEF